MRYALIGCGMISPNHIKAALANDLEIVALCDLVGENRNKALDLIPEEKRAGVKLYENHLEMLELLASEGHVVDVGRNARVLVGVEHGVDDLHPSLSIYPIPQ